LLLIAGTAQAALPSFIELRARYQPSDGQLLDRNGRLLQEQRLRWQGRSLGWTPLAAMSPALKQAVVAVEDHRFFTHRGVDSLALLGAAWQNLAHGTRRGASTITMQVVGLIEDHRGRRGWWDKYRQARLAWELEKSWSKEQILEAYLNLVSYRGEQAGVAAAARALFAKEPHGLDLRESYLLAVLLRAPGSSAETAAARLCHSLGECDSMKAWVLATLSAAHAPLPRAQLAPHLARKIFKAEKSREVRSTLDLGLQQAALDAIHDQLSQLRARNVRDASLIAVDNRTGEVLAYVGSSGGFSASPEVDMTQSRRQAGSTLKPFLYALAFDRNYIRPDSWLLDEPLALGLDRGSYEPDNYDHSFHGPVRASEALASSLNVPAVRLVNLVGVDAFQGLLDRLGFRELEDGEHYGPSLALGTADITLADLVQAYMTLANEGVWRPLVFKKTEKTSSRRLLSASAARDVSAILSDRGSRALTFGWDSLLATAYPAAVKTGTSKDMRDNWCIGFSRDFTVGVWVGNAGGDPMWQVSGITGAAPVWRALMDRLHEGRRPKAFASLPPASAGFVPPGFHRILYPAAGSVLALDPDIPDARQRVVLEAEGGGNFWLDGEKLASSVWRPVKGKHRLRLADTSGASLDEVSFEVR
jgi:penicillin-binding protein 1C